MKLCVIINPAAGSVKDVGQLLKQIETLKPAAIRVTRKAGDAKKLTEEAIRERFKYIISAGGDGTLNEVVNGMARHREEIRLGLLPLGTGNDFARCLNLPSTIEENVRLLKRGKTQPLDLVQVRSARTRYFINVSAGGFSGLVDEKLTRKIKKTWGPLAYVRSAAAAFPDLHAYRTEVVLDNEPLSLNLYNIVIANGRFVAGGLPIAPKARVTDGLLDVILIPERSRAELIVLAAEILLGRHLRSRIIKFRRVRQVFINSHPGMCFNVDGEFVGNVPARFEVLPKALQFVTGKR